jgi:hypothetical protein
MRHTEQEPGRLVCLREFGDDGQWRLACRCSRDSGRWAMTIGHATRTGGDKGWRRAVAIAIGERTRRAGHGDAEGSERRWATTTERGWRVRVVQAQRVAVPVPVTLTVALALGLTRHGSSVAAAATGGKGQAREKARLQQEGKTRAGRPLRRLYAPALAPRRPRTELRCFP